MSLVKVCVGCKKSKFGLDLMAGFLDYVYAFLIYVFTNSLVAKANENLIIIMVIFLSAIFFFSGELIALT